MILEIGNKYYNAKEIRKISTDNKHDIVITYVNGDIEYTDYFMPPSRLEELINEWKKCLK